MAKFDLEALINDLPAGLDRAMLRVLSFHRGRNSAIGRPQLVSELARMGFQVHERQARACINQLRKSGSPICSTGGTDGGYYLASDWNELNDYIKREIEARAFDLLEQAKALRAQAEQTWGKYSPEQQARMF